MNPNLKNIIIGVVVVLIVVFSAITYLNRQPYVADELVTGITTTANAGMLDGNFISALNALKRLKLDSSIFTSPLWSTLTDFGRTLAPQASGRTNPFAPIGSGDASQ